MENYVRADTDNTDTQRGPNSLLSISLAKQVEGLQEIRRHQQRCHFDGLCQFQYGCTERSLS